MTDLTEARVGKIEDDGSNGRSVLWIMLAGLGIITAAGGIGGFVAGYLAEGDRAFSDFAIGVIAGFVGVMVALAYAIWRNARNLKLNGGPATRREKLNRNIVIACGLIGGVMGAVVAMTGIANSNTSVPDSFSEFVNGPMPTNIALPLALFWAVGMPVIAWFWHTRAIDEQEASAYRDGGYYAAYAYLILAPAWWILWRGGLLPQPDGVAIYVTFSVIWTLVWFWKKYR